MIFQHKESLLFKCALVTLYTSCICLPVHAQMLAMRSCVALLIDTPVSNIHEVKYACPLHMGIGMRITHSCGSWCYVNIIYTCATKVIPQHIAHMQNCDGYGSACAGWQYRLCAQIQYYREKNCANCVTRLDCSFTPILLPTLHGNLLCAAV